MTEIDRSKFNTGAEALKLIKPAVSRTTVADLEALRHRIAAMEAKDLVYMSADLNDPRAIVTCIFAFTELDRRGVVGSKPQAPPGG